MPLSNWNVCLDYAGQHCKDASKEAMPENDMVRWICSKFMVPGDLHIHYTHYDVINLIVKRYYFNNWFFARCAVGLVAFMMLFVDASGATASKWVPLAKDDLHDPKGPAITLLQEPAEGLSTLPADKVGNMVDWVQAIAKGVINPRRVKNQLGDPLPMLQTEIMMDKEGSMPMVLFPHKVHTMWLECSNCHPAIFEAKVGANNIRMEKILNGEQCGLCHGAVAFPPTNCSRCHSVQH